MPTILRKLCCASSDPEESENTADVAIVSEEQKAKDAVEFLEEDPFWTT